ncbi:MAG: SDR family NAD(P)-dependent oxidoreductase [Oscillospiraceae bacterium]|jgi:short-subunit dehydrogenase|nr:SDR family NAD(P)-dependent oxidoreductase [Oscillospiraceae bacterium]
MKQIAVITGASSGMGREFALQLSAWQTFDEYWVIARRAERLEALAQELRVPVRVIALDLTDADALAHYGNLLETAKPNVGLLANISGFGKFGRYDQIPLEDSMKMIDLNCKALVAMTDLTLPYMKRGAKIVNLDSLSAFQPVPYLNTYAATKAFVLSYTRSLGRELKPRGIRVMSVNPGWVKTEFFDHAEQTSSTAVTYFNRLYEAKDVIATALKHLYKTKKEISIHGLPVRNQVRLVKLLPHSLVMRIWLHQQKHDKE